MNNLKLAIITNELDLSIVTFDEAIIYSKEYIDILHEIDLIMKNEVTGDDYLKDLVLNSQYFILKNNSIFSKVTNKEIIKLIYKNE